MGHNLTRAAALCLVGAGIWFGYDRFTRPDPPPSNVADACVIASERPGWYAAAREASEKWRIGIPTLLAIIWRESSFRAEARPPRRWHFGFIPGKRLSTAYGFSQALDGTWQRYVTETGAGRAHRTDFADAADFVGWYAAETRKRLAVPVTDPVRHYLAYHQGHAGFRSGRWQRKPWLIKAARDVLTMSMRYDEQLRGCDPAYALANSVFASPVPRAHPRRMLTSPTPVRRPLRKAEM